MEQKKQYTIGDLPVPGPELCDKAWRKVVLDVSQKAIDSQANLDLMISRALGDLPDGPERDEILRDWRAAYESYGILAATILDQMENTPPHHPKESE